MRPARRRILAGGLALLPWVAGRASTGPVTLTINRSSRYQTIEGFGTALNGWHPNVVTHLQSEAFSRFYLDTLGASVVRIDLWADSAPVARERWQDVSRHDFLFEGRGQRGRIFLEVVRKLHAAASGKIRVIASVWSPPPWMKRNATLGNGHPKRRNYALDFGNPVELGRWDAPQDGPTGAERYQYVGLNKLRPDRYEHFAKVLVEWTRLLRSSGIELYALSPQNEPRFSHWFESCVYTPAEYAELLDAIVLMFRREGEPLPKLFGPEHMTRDLPGNRLYLEAIAKRPDAFRAVEALAAHGYIDGQAPETNPEFSRTFRSLAEQHGKRVWFTEGGSGEHDWPAPLRDFARSFVYALREGNASLITPWQAVTRDPPSRSGFMSLSQSTKKTSVAIQLWRYLRPGMVRVGVEGESSDLESVAFEDPASARVVLVILNRAKTAVPVSVVFAPVPMTAQAAYLTDATHDHAPTSDWRRHGTNDLPPESITTVAFQ